MFLFQQGLQRGACLFNLMKTSHRGSYNQLMAQEGRTVFILKQKEFMVTGFAAPDFDAEEFGASRIKDDALYVFIIYEKTPDSPFTPVNEEFLEYGTLEVGGDGEPRITPGSKAVMDQITGPKSPQGHIVIDVSAAVEGKPKKSTGKKAAKVEKSPKAGAKGGPIADFNKKRVSKAKTPGEALERVTENVLGELGQMVDKAAKQLTQEMKDDVGIEGMRGIMREQLLKDPMAMFKSLRDTVGSMKAKAIVFNELKAKDARRASKFMQDLEADLDPPKAKKKPAPKKRGKAPTPKGRS